MTFRPGTVSRILWHFTGGPRWDDKLNKQLKCLKPAINSYKALKSIIESSELRVGNYSEIVKIIVPRKKVYNKKTKTVEILNDYPVTVKSKPVCCIADIPLQHIAYHANRYGKIAIGFHRNSIVAAGFNPVMYTLENTRLLNSIYKGYTSINDVDPWDARDETESLQNEIDSMIDENNIDDTVDTSSISSSLDDIESGHDEIEQSYDNFLAYIKTFDPSEFDTIYCEREWRSISNFSFKVEDIAMVVLPKEQDGFSFYEKFLNEVNIPRTTTVACWENIVEH